MKGLSSSRTRAVWIDIVRTIAIILIIGFHVAYELTRDEGLRYIGYVGDSFFFIASGYMLAVRYPEIKSLSRQWMWRRYVKLASLYYPALVAMLLLFFASSQGLLDSIYDLILHFTFLNWIAPDHLFTLISPAWFIIPLFYLYVAYPYLNRALASSRHIFIIIVLITLGARIYDGVLRGAWATSNPLFFLDDFCFGIVLARYGQDVVLIAPLVYAIINPILALPYAAFYLFFSLEPALQSLPCFAGAVFNFFGAYTFEFFLFHESVMKVALGRWNVYGLGVLPSLVVLALALFAVEFISNSIRRALLKEEGG